ncbi:MAG: exo-alpha-sialidase [Verrucomicrobia bacterium]|nr:exo-alpha-sialidase [Verrucomicrobiota bacterium]
MQPKVYIGIFLSFLSTICHAGSSDRFCTSHVYEHKPEVLPLMHVTNISRLPPSLSCLSINNHANLTGYGWYQNVAFDSQISVNPKNPDNMIIVAQQDTLSNAHYQGALPLSVIVLYTVDGGTTWNESDLILSRCQGATNYKANNNFLAAYFPTVTFGPEGNCYVFFNGYNLFAANQMPDVSLDEGNIVAKSIDGGKSWNQITSTFRDDGSCHYLDYPDILADPYRKNTLYVVSSDDTCFLSGSCTDPDFTGNLNITFQKSTDAGASWSPVSLIASFPPDNPTTCTPLPILNQIAVLPDHKHTLLVTSMLEESPPDSLNPTPYDRLLAWRSSDGGETWHMHTVADNIPHILVVDPDTSNPVLPVTDWTTKDMAISRCNGNVYVVYSDPQFTTAGQAGCVIKMSKDGGKSWSKPRPVNPNSLNTQAFMPTVAVAKDGTVGVLFYDFRHFTSGSPELSTDVWMSFFDKDLKHCSEEVRLTPTSFDTRKSIRGYNGVDQMNCYFDYYLSNHVGLYANGNDFIAAFTITNGFCEQATIGTYPCDSFPLSTDDCNRQDIAYVRICRHDK